MPNCSTMSSEGYLMIDDSDSSSSISHFVRRDYRSRSLAFWAMLALCLCGFVILTRTLFCFPTEKESDITDARITSAFLSKLPQPKRTGTKIEEIMHNETEKRRIRRSSRIIEGRANCIGHCVRNCNRTTSSCIFTCTNRCIQSSSHPRITKARRMIIEKVLGKETEYKKLGMREAHNGHFAEVEIAHDRYNAWRKVHCVSRFCLHIAKFCSMLTKHSDSSCDNDLQQCEIEHCGVDEFCVQVVHDGMENEPIIATIRVLQVCLHAGLFYS